MIQCSGLPARMARAFGAVAFAAVALSACAPRPPSPDTAEAVSYRNPAITLAGTTRFDADRFAGDWITRACIGVCAPAMGFHVSQTGAVVEADNAGSRSYQVDGPGILRAIQTPDVLVVMWVDDGFRTAAIGTANGQRAAVIDRAATGGGDRIAAAREILDFNGWDIRQLRDMRQ